MIRGRGGSRSRYRPAETHPPVLEGQGQRSKQARSADGATGPEATPAKEPAAGAKQGEGSLEGNDQAKRRKIISQLTKRYSGIGAKTAETLIEAFGADVYRVLDDEPERVREVLPEARASRILEARREELKAGGE